MWRLSFGMSSFAKDCLQLISEQGFNQNVEVAYSIRLALY